MKTYFRLILQVVFLLLPYLLIAQESSLHGGKIFIGIVIKNNDRLIPAFLKSIENLDYDKKLITLEVAVYNESPEIKDKIENWLGICAETYLQTACKHMDIAPSVQNNYSSNEKHQFFAEIKNGFLRKAKELNCDYCFITESDVFLAPFTLKELVKKDKPIIAPLLRPTPEPYDPFRNFFADVTEAGFYKDSPIYSEISDRIQLGTFSVPCVYGAYLIKFECFDKLNFLGSPNDYDFVAFSRNARKNNVEQFICNEREFGTYVHLYKAVSLEDEKSFYLAGIDINVDKGFIRELFSEHIKRDPFLKEYLARFELTNYAIYRVENRDLYFVDEPFDFIKSKFIKKGMRWERHLDEVFKKYVTPGSVVLDIGGHIGTHTLSLSRLVGQEGTVHVFEPQLKIFTENVINMRLNDCKNVIFHRNPLGNQEMWIGMSNECVTNEGMAKISLGVKKNVKMEKLDNLKLKNVSFIKIDVECYEPHIIEGGKETILNNMPVMVVEIIPTAEFDSTKEKIEKLGYEVTHLLDNDYLCLPIEKK